jgi:hypothetical protein
VTRLSTSSMIIMNSRLMLPEVSAMHLNSHQGFLTTCKPMLVYVVNISANLFLS